MSLSFGISPALVTPFAGGSVDVRRLADHAKDCLARGCRTATVFGTTGEGPSVGAVERDRVAVGYLPPERLPPLPAGDSVAPALI